ncbi:MAG TPA: ADP-ribosylglycohydrolase family protein [Bacteroidales bacterium]|nr:ADP-ribosylglycohydrolase family protein [Bacteroidales bacterium]
MVNKLLFSAFLFLLLFSCKSNQENYLTITPEELKDKIAGGWAGKMIGVTYGAPTEFGAQGKTFEDSIKWTPADIKGSIWQDDLYVQLTFLMAMDEYGIDAPAKKFQELFARAGYPLWHANVQARKNYYDSIFPPQSGNPQFNYHADDIDFQIEADYIGFMCPGMPRKAAELCDKPGHIMNYGDGFYGGVFVAALYSEAFFNDDIPSLIENALKSIPSASDYAAIIRDVILLHSHYPSDWRSAWKELEAKWGDVDICGAGSTFNIDAKLNGAYIVMGLLYGEGDPMKTLEVSTRCGQDSDCNPSNALAVLGVMHGFSKLPETMKEGIRAVADSVFINTNYTFNKAVESSYKYAVRFIGEQGGEVSEKQVKIVKQAPAELPLEVSFPDVVFDKKISLTDKISSSKTGDWISSEKGIVAAESGSSLEIPFEGTGIVLMGSWVKDGGKAEVFLDNESKGVFDTYFFYSNQEHEGINLWHIFGLPSGKHILKLVVKGEKRPESAGVNVYVKEALVFKTSPKKNQQYHFSFEK